MASHKIKSENGHSTGFSDDSAIEDLSNSDSVYFAEGNVD